MIILLQMQILNLFQIVRLISLNLDHLPSGHPYDHSWLLPKELEKVNSIGTGQAVLQESLHATNHEKISALGSARDSSLENILNTKGAIKDLQNVNTINAKSAVDQVKVNIANEGHVSNDIIELDLLDTTVLPGLDPTRGNAPGGNAPSSNAPSGNARSDAPSGNAPGSNAPSGNAPGGNAPSSNAPSGNARSDAPSGNAPGSNAPSGNAPGSNAPSGNAPKKNQITKDSSKPNNDIKMTRTQINPTFVDRIKDGIFRILKLREYHPSYLGRNAQKEVFYGSRKIPKPPKIHSLNELAGAGGGVGLLAGGGYGLSEVKYEKQKQKQKRI
jgi:hypothetical protein